MTTDNVMSQLNGDTAANYGYFFWDVFNSAMGADNTASVSSFMAGRVFGTGGPTNGAGANVLEIPSYAGTTFAKQMMGIMGATSFGSTSAGLPGGMGGEWNSTAAINSVKLMLASGGNFKAGSAFYLYGVT